jgi:hypothetical protein
LGIALTGNQDDVLERLQDAARLDLGDFLGFEVVPDPEHPEMQNDRGKDPRVHDAARARPNSRVKDLPDIALLAGARAIAAARLRDGA